jgi:hypothetical protein
MPYHQPGLFERVEHRHDVPVDDGVKIGVEIDVILARLGTVEGREFVVGVARQLLDFWLGRKIVGIVVRQSDAEMSEVLAPVASLLPGARLHPGARIGPDIVGLTSDMNMQNGLSDLGALLFRNSTTLSPPTPAVWPRSDGLSPLT